MPTITTLVSFNGVLTEGSTPEGSLIADANGDLFGTTEFGGADGDGTVFEIPNTGTGYVSSPTTLISFDGTNGEAPYAGLIMDAAGDLFGTTTDAGVGGYGTVFELVNNGDGDYTLNTLVSFNTTNGAYPYAGLIMDAAGNLFGTTKAGGLYGDGTVFEIAKSGTGYAPTPTTLVTFNGSDGQEPYAGLIMDAAGDLFGTTWMGGLYGDGTVFEIAKNGVSYAKTPTTLANFNGSDGSGPQAALITDAAGDLFGTTSGGGVSDAGTVFEVVNNGDGDYTLNTLVSFNGASGDDPIAGLTADAAGDLFGTTFYGGVNGEGTVFEIAKTGTGYAATPKTLVTFNFTNGAYPYAGLIADAAGDLFGTTYGGGAGTPAAVGTVFEITGSGFEPPCYCRGTLIRTRTGDVPVETLAVGDRLVTLSGQAKPIVWIGMGRVLATPGRRSAATPIIVRRSALADNVPNRDLRITKGHSLYLDGVLVPAEFLINYHSILWDDRAQVVEFYHIELASHDVLLADGAAAESYRDDGNRWLFQNANSGWSEPPKPPCAPVLTGGAIVDALWRRLLDRAGPRPAVPVTDEPDLHLLVDGRRMDASRYPAGHYTFRLPRCPAEVRLASRAGSPAKLGLARDPRLLGVAVRQIRLWQGARLRLLEAADAALATGFHGFEPDEGLRWTDGNALLPPDFFAGMDGPCELDVLTCGATNYPLVADETELIAA